MPQLFPKWANQVPRLLLIVMTFSLLGVVLGVWYFAAAAWVEVGYAPKQPVDYSHQIHAGKLGLDCRYCHSTVEISAKAMIPATQTCMNCHNQIRTDSPKLELVRESWRTGQPIEWVRIHNIPDYAQFNHSAHVNVGVGCATCHGRIDKMAVVSQQEPLSMGWCLECHRNPAPNLRPIKEVTNMSWVPGEGHKEWAQQQIQKLNIAPPTYCNGCHY